MAKPEEDLDTQLYNLIQSSRYLFKPSPEESNPQIDEKLTSLEEYRHFIETQDDCGAVLLEKKYDLERSIAKTTTELNVAIANLSKYYAANNVVCSRTIFVTFVDSLHMESNDIITCISNYISANPNTNDVGYLIMKLKRVFTASEFSDNSFAFLKLITNVIVEKCEHGFSIQLGEVIGGILLQSLSTKHAVGLFEILQQLVMATQIPANEIHLLEIYKALSTTTSSLKRNSVLEMIFVSDKPFSNWSELVSSNSIDLPEATINEIAIQFMHRELKEEIYSDVEKSSFVKIFTRLLSGKSNIDDATLQKLFSIYFRLGFHRSDNVLVGYSAFFTALLHFIDLRRNHSRELYRNVFRALSLSLPSNFSFYITSFMNSFIHYLKFYPDDAEIVLFVFVVIKMSEQNPASLKLPSTLMKEIMTKYQNDHVINTRAFVTNLQINIETIPQSRNTTTTCLNNHPMEMLQPSALETLKTKNELFYLYGVSCDLCRSNVFAQPAHCCAKCFVIFCGHCFPRVSFK